ncbi:MAG: sigma-70 family RNA polymerase sigma factor [Deltaproteobacteria bacterium]|nr:sigma-70 family RNA polymerase sigma factor [Deltaproteobacteria bacterium]
MGRRDMPELDRSFVEGVTSLPSTEASVATPEETVREATPPEWDAIIRQHERRVLVFLVGMGLAFDRAQEISQMTWVRLFEQHRSGRLTRLDFPGLALEQARFLALDELRRARSHPRADGAEPAIETTRDPEAQVLEREALDQVRAALLDCPLSAQRVFRLLYGDPPLSHAEAAAKLGLSVQRVRQILCETRRKLRAALGPMRGQP